MASNETPKPTQAEEPPAVAVAGEQTKSSGDGDVTKKEEDGSASKTVHDPAAEEINADSSSSSAACPIEDGGGATSKEERDSNADLREHERRALVKLKALVEDAILANKMFDSGKSPPPPPPPADQPQEKSEKVTGDGLEKNEKQEEKNQPSEAKQGETEPTAAKEEEKPDAEKKNTTTEEEKNKAEEADKDVSLWGVPLLPSKGDKSTDVVLFKFLTAKDFRVNEAFEMLKATLQWRKQMKIDSVLEEDFGPDLNSAAYISGVDREGHPVCYNTYGVFSNDEIYNKTLGTEEGREKFLRWRAQIMEKGIRKLDFQPGGVSSLVHISDLKNTPGPARKELRLATKQDVGLLQDNYPELVARNIFINVPFWYYAFNALLPPILTPKNKNKFVFVRPTKVTETLLKYFTAQEIPVQYGGLKRENDNVFSVKDEIQELSLKGSTRETIEIPAPEVGSTLVWEFTVFGWDIEYKEEFVPEDPGSYTIIVQKEKRINWQDDSVRNSFTTREPGKVVISIENGSYKKKRVMYRSKAKDSSASSSTN